MQIPNFIYGAAVGGVAVSNGLSNLFLFAFIPIFYRIYTSESIFSAIKIGAVAGWAYGLVSLLWLSTPVDVLGAPPIVGYLVPSLASLMI